LVKSSISSSILELLGAVEGAPALPEDSILLGSRAGCYWPLFSHREVLH
jgi:hypothetical protein